MCLLAFRQTIKGGPKELAESSLRKLSETLTILRENHYEIIDCRNLNSELFYTFGILPTVPQSYSFTNIVSYCESKGRFRIIRPFNKRFSPDT